MSLCNYRVPLLCLLTVLSAGYLSAEPIAPGGVEGDGQTSLVYDRGTGNLSVDAANTEGFGITAIEIISPAGIFDHQPARNLGGWLDVHSANKVFKIDLKEAFGSIDFGPVADIGLTEEFLLGDLQVDGAKLGGGDLGSIDLVFLDTGGDIPDLSDLPTVSFSALEETSRWNANFGTIAKGSTPSALGVEIFNLAAADADSAVDLVEVISISDSAGLYATHTGLDVVGIQSDLAPIQAIAPGVGQRFSFGIDTSVPGRYRREWGLVFQDSGDPTGPAATLWINVEGFVVEPEQLALTYDASSGAVEFQDVRDIDGEPFNAVREVTLASKSGILEQNEVTTNASILTSDQSTIHINAAEVADFSLGSAVPQGLDEQFVLNDLTTQAVLKDGTTVNVPLRYAPLPEPASGLLFVVGVAFLSVVVPSLDRGIGGLCRDAECTQTPKV